MFLTPGSRARQQSFASLLLRRFARSQPHAPSDGVEVFAQRKAGRQMAGQIAPVGATYEFQPGIGSKKVSWLATLGNSSSVQSMGWSNSGAGTATARNVANTSAFTAIRRLGYVPASAAINIPAGLSAVAQNWRGNAANAGGFLFVARFGFNSLTSGNRLFVGLCNSVAVFSTGDPSAATDLIGVGFDAADALAFKAISVNGSGTATKLDLGKTAATSVLYEVRVFCSPNDTKITVSLEDLTNNTYVEQTMTTTLPTAGTFLNPQAMANTGTQTTGAQIDIVNVYVETDW